MRPTLKLALNLALIALLAALLASYGGALHPAGDSLAVFRGQMALGLVVVVPLLAAIRLRRRATAVLGLAAIAGLPVAWAGQSASVFHSDTNFSLYQKNLSFRAHDLSPLETDIRATSADFVTLQEVTGANAALIRALSDTLPTAQFCGFAGVGGVAVLSRWPKVAGSGICDDGLAAMQVETPRGRVWLVSLHLHWPWPYGQAAQVNRLLPALQTLDGKVVLGGDFNMVPWSHTYAEIARATRAQRANAAQGTLALAGGWLTLPIDHVLGPYGGEAGLRPRLGSDHMGVLARIGL